MNDHRLHVSLIVETSKAFGRGILQGIAKYMKVNELWSIYIDERGPTDPPPSWLRDWNGHGVIVRGRTKKVLDVVSELNVPAVNTLNQFSESTFPSVIADDVAIAEMAAARLLDAKLQNFAFVGVERAHWSKLRGRAFAEAIGRAGFDCLTYLPLSRRRFHQSWEGGQEDLADWIRELPKPIGIMAAHDLRALCVLDACRRTRTAVPDEVAVIGVDNDEILCDLADPPLTSVELDLVLHGFEAAAILANLMKGKSPRQSTVKIKPIGVVTRQSTDILVIDDREMAMAVRFIRQNACKGIDVPAVAKVVGMSRRVLERRFKEAWRCSPHEEIVRAKIARAKELLTRTDLTLDTVATKCGFAQASYLSTLFKQTVDLTPGEFRNIEQSRGSLLTSSSNGDGNASLRQYAHN